MFFLASKIFWAFAQPLTLLSFLFLTDLIFRKRSWARQVGFIAGILFLIFGILPVGPLLVRYLESEYDSPAKLPDRVDGIIVLGGAVNAEGSGLRGQPQLNEWSERIFEMMRLSRRYPQAKLIYSGGAGSLQGSKYKEADIVRTMLSDIGFNHKNMIFENRSRTTFENIEFSRRLVSPQAGENWVVITSAFHMPRAVLIFKKQGWAIIPYPAGFIENGSLNFWSLVDISSNYWKLNIAAHEIIGIIAYKLSGKL